MQPAVTCWGFLRPSKSGCACILSFVLQAVTNVCLFVLIHARKNSWTAIQFGASYCSRLLFGLRNAVQTKSIQKCCCKDCSPSLLPGLCDFSPHFLLTPSPVSSRQTKSPSPQLEGPVSAISSQGPLALAGVCKA